MSVTFRGTTICAVKRNGHIAIAGDGQVTMGEHTIFKGNARKVRRIFGGQVAVGFAGSVADAFTLCEKFEEKLTQFSGNLPRSAVELAQEWQSDRARKLEAMLLCADKDNLLLVSGTGAQRARGARGRGRGPKLAGRSSHAAAGFPVDCCQQGDHAHCQRQRRGH